VASDTADFITGQIIAVNGGKTLRNSVRTMTNLGARRGSPTLVNPSDLSNFISPELE
jgi:hypothetical protein